MKIKKGFIIENHSGQNILVYKGSEKISFTQNIVLSETAVFLWRYLEKNNATKAQMLGALIEAFDISTVLALGDIDTFVKTLKANGIIEE